MIRKDTGELILETGFIIAPTLKREDFLQSHLGEISTVFVKNEPWCSYRIIGQKISEIVFVLVLFFHGSELLIIHLADIDKKYGSSWDDWSKEKELERKKSHEDWLNKVIGKDRSFAWGEIKSVYDDKAGSSHIILSYKKP